MHLGKIFATLALAGALGLASFTGAAADDLHGQPPSPPQQAPAAAGGFGPTWLGAVIDAAGNHVAGTGGLGLSSSSRISVGNYEVLFRRVITLCVPVASIGNRGFGSAHGHVDVVQRGGNNRGFFVQTKDTSGIAADLNFTLLVFCTT